MFVSDDAFALKPYLMKPYLQSGLDNERMVYNYRHSQARKISENLFGIIANRWRVFHSVILLPPKSIEILTLGTFCIHDYLRQSASKSIYCPSDLNDRESQSGDIFLGRLHNNPPTESSLYPLEIPNTGDNSSTDAKEVRETLNIFFL